MIGLLWNILLAVSWVALSGDFSPLSFATGFAFGFLILLFLQRVISFHSYTNRVFQLFILLAVFLWDLLLANLNVAYHVINPRHSMQSGIVAIPLSVKTDIEIVLLASIISLTPGTLSLHITDDRKTFYIHALHISDPGKMRQMIKNRVEKRILEVTR